jgi:flagellar motor switch protein FliN/FliY
MNEGLLSQQEINSLLQKNAELSSLPGLTEGEKDVLGEVSNISMGSAAMALSSFLSREATISGMKIDTLGLDELKADLDLDRLVLKAQFDEGLEGYVLLALASDKLVLAMDPNLSTELGDGAFGISDGVLANTKEGLNNMLTALLDTIAGMVGRNIGVLDPDLWHVGPDTDKEQLVKGIGAEVARVDFDLQLETIGNSRASLILSIDAARAIVEALSTVAEAVEAEARVEEQEKESKIVPEIKDREKKQVSIQKPQFSQLREDVKSTSRQNIDLILDVPLELSVVLGNTSKSIREILSLNPGSVIELGKYTEEPLEVYVNGKLIAQGEVVVINENFGIRITNIISAAERVKKL